MGPWNWTDDEQGVIFEGWEGFVAVEEVRGSDRGRSVWALYFDRNDDGLKEIANGKRVLQVSLERKLIGNEDGVEEVVHK